MKYFLRSPRRLMMVAIDVAIFAACYYLSFALRFEDWRIKEYFGQFLSTLPPLVFFEFLFLYLAGVYRTLWRYVSVNDLLNIVKGVIGSTGAHIAWVVFISGFIGYPRSVFLINAFLVIMGVGGVRLARRCYIEKTLFPPKKRHGKPVLIVGAGDAADNLIRELLHNPKMSCRPIGIVDDHPDKLATEIHGVKVLGGIDDIPALVEGKEVAEIMIAIPSAGGAQMRRIVSFCRRTGVPYRTMPGIGDIIDGRIKVQQLRKVKIEDLLRRPEVKLDRAAVGRFVSGKRVLVTGAGGSIGTELCRQIARFAPEEIILLDHCENSLFYMERELAARFPGLIYKLKVADVANRGRIGHLMQKIKPAVVFHAAAHKHVPLMESNRWAAFLNNVTGTRIMAEESAAAGVEKFIMISTDKAVNPGSIMGLSKRLAEMVIQGLNGNGGGRTEFIAVRFGNVMGSEGSVIPLFARQIEDGGPVTVTHPEAVRYFMTIPEAAQLVLQAAAMGKGGEIFILEMGEPVRILDLARDMITLSGLEPGGDIEIKITGLRPGEKLCEELITQGEGIVPTPHEKIMVLRSTDGGVSEAAMRKIERIEDLAISCSDFNEIMEIAGELVPDYRPANHRYHQAS